MDVFQPHIHAFGVKSIVKVARDTLGPDALEEILRGFATTSEEVGDPNAWFSIHFVEALLDEVVKRAGDPTLPDKIAIESMKRASLGFVYTVVRAFGSPRFAYERTARDTSRFNKLGAYTFEALGPRKVKLCYRRLEGAPQASSPHICRIRLRQLAEMPTMFHLAAAEVEHPLCLMRGDPSCDYILKWQEPPRRRLAIAGLVVGALLATLLLALFGPLQGWVGAALALALSMCGWTMGRARDLQRELAERAQDLLDHQETLKRSLRSNEDRFQELLEAKTEVERKVEERTSELKEATQRLSLTLDEVRAVDRAKTDFFNNVSHELRSPLTMIVAPLEDLAEGRSPPGGAAVALDSMRRNARRLLLLINQLLDLAKVDAGEARAALAPTDLGALVRGVLAGFEAAAGRKGLELALQCPHNMSSVALDASWIESAVTNLIANALRVTERGGVRVVVSDRGSDVTVSIADDGPGIAPEDQAKIFERFAQGDVGKRIVGGTGIGLSLVREATRLHRGSVTVSSELGKGATFVLTLPRRAPTGSIAPPPLTASSAQPFANEAAALAEELDVVSVDADRIGPSADAPLVLIVEDNVELRRFMADVLGARFRVRSAVDGVEGLRLVHELHPEVVVSDVAMPRMNGYELCRALRADEHTRGLPVLLVTARTEVASVLEGFDAGANDYVLKPFHGRELLARVEVHVRLRRMVQQLALRERHAVLGVMAASVAHQVRNPLTALVGGLPAMRNRVKDRVDERTLELIEVMIDCAARIERMTGDLMNLSRVDREAESPYRPSDGLRAAVRLARARADAAGVQIEEHIEDAPLIRGRPGDMNHVFLNLLDNAVRAVAGGGRIRVEAALRGERHYVVRVGDSGSGVDPEHMSRIFEPFYTTRAAGEGTGLGLGVALQVVTACGGRIEVGESELGGALFEVLIPVGSSLVEAKATVEVSDLVT